MSADNHEKDVVWQVVGPGEKRCRRMEQHLESGGFRVIREGILPSDVRLGTVKPAVEITEREREVLEALLAYDHSHEIAEALSI